jgi:hypothetical protein
MGLGKKHWNLKSLINCKLYQFKKIIFQNTCTWILFERICFLIEEITYFCDWITSKNIHNILL